MSAFSNPMCNDSSQESPGFTKNFKWFLDLIPKEKIVRQKTIRSLVSLKDVDTLCGTSGLKDEIDDFSAATFELSLQDTSDYRSRLEVGAKISKIALEIIPKILKVDPITETVFNLLIGGLSVFNVYEEATIENVLKHILQEHTDREFLKECEAVQHEFVISAKYLCGIGLRKLETHEVAAVSANVPIQAGVKLMHRLSKIIEDLKRKQENYLNENFQKIGFEKLMKYLDVYCCLAILRNGVLLHFLSILIKSENSSALVDGTKSVIRDNQKKDQTLLEFLVKPNLKTIITHFLYEPSKWKTVEKCLEINGLRVDVDYLCEGTYTIRPVAHDDASLYMSDIALPWIRWSGSKDPSQTKFTFQKDQKEKHNYFKIFSHKWPSYFVRMEFNGLWVRGTNEMDDEQAVFKIAPINGSNPETVHYMLSPKIMTTHFLYGHFTGRVGGKHCGRPKDQCLWIIEKT